MNRWSLVCELASALGAKPETVKKWRQRGIPPRWFFPLLAEARARGEILSEADLLETPRSLSTTSVSEVA